MRTWAWGAAAAWALAVGIAACESTDTSASPGAGGDSLCGATVFSPMVECQACVEASCCAALEACNTGTSCAALLLCLATKNCSAGDTACITACEDKASDAGVQAAQALESCYDTNCSMQTVCQTGAICQSGFEVPNAQCGMCLGSSCCAQWTACGADATCSGCANSQGMNPGCQEPGSLYVSAVKCEHCMCSADCTQVCDTGLTTNNPPCDLCLDESCCGLLDACINDSTCDMCLLSSSPPSSCSDDMAFSMATACQSAHCATQCMSGGCGQGGGDGGACDEDAGAALDASCTED
jgi:hypothetical protein